MRVVYSYRWSSSITDDLLEDAANVWTRVLAGITPDQVAKGVAKVEASADGWPPTPGQFRALCLPTPADLGLPDRETAWQQAVGNAKLSHPVVWHVRERVGAWNLKNLPQAATRRKFDDAWAEAVAGFADDEEAFGWPGADADAAGQLEDTRGARGRRGPTPASDLALAELRQKWGKAPAPPEAGQGAGEGRGERHHAGPSARAPETAAQSAQEA